jgi:hypothetical protein
MPASSGTPFGKVRLLIKKAKETPDGAHEKYVALAQLRTIAAALIEAAPHDALIEFCEFLCKYRERMDAANTAR